MKQLFIYSYEFGYQIWHSAMIRKCRKMFHDIVVCSFPGREILYKDIARRYIELPERYLDNFEIDKPNETNVEELSELIKLGYGEFKNYKTTYNFSHPIFRRFKRADWAGKAEYVDYPNTRTISPTKYINFYPRYNPITHSYRNYPPDKLKMVIEEISNRYPVRIVIFDKLPSELKKIRDVEIIESPPLEEQINLLSEAKCNFYVHSGAILLALMTCQRRPIFSISDGGDRNLYLHPTHKIWDRVKHVKNYSKGELKVLDPDEIINQFYSFMDIVKREK